MKSFFSHCEVIDWYDGAVYGLGERMDPTEFYLFYIVAVDLITHEKIFICLKINFEFFELHKKLIKFGEIDALYNLQSSYSFDKILLLKAMYIESNDYELKEIENSQITQYSGVEDVWNQSIENTKKWFDFFRLVSKK